MAKESVRIELDEKDIKELVAEKWGLDPRTCTINISHYNGDQREPAYTNITVSGEKSVKNTPTPYEDTADWYGEHTF